MLRLFYLGKIDFKKHLRGCNEIHNYLVSNYAFIDNAVIYLFEQLFFDRFDSFEFTVYIIMLLSVTKRQGMYFS